jgi:ferredoxin
MAFASAGRALAQAGGARSIIQGASARLARQSVGLSVLPSSTRSINLVHPFASSSRLSLHTSAVRGHGGIERPAPGTGIKVTFRDSKGKDLKTVEVNEGDDLLSIAHEYDVDLEGACEGSIACSTCHVILQPDIYDALEEPGDDENDMLDLAFGLTDTWVCAQGAKNDER